MPPKSKKSKEPEEKRIDPDDKVAYTYSELAEYYKGKYKKAAIAAYWDTCKPVKAKAKAKAKEKAKAKPKAKSNGGKTEKKREEAKTTAGH